MSDIHVITNIEEIGELPLEKQLEFLKTGQVIDDRREKEIKGKPYTINFKKCLTTPDDSGIYRVPTNEGIKDCIVAIAPKILGADANCIQIMVMAPDTGNYCFVEKSHDMVVSTEDIPLLRIVEKFETRPVDNMQVNKKYVLYHHDEDSRRSCYSVPFMVRSKTKAKDGEQFFEIEMQMFGMPYNEISCSPAFDHRVFLHTRDKNLFSKFGNTIFVPKKAMVVECKGHNTLHVLNEDLALSNIFEDKKSVKIAGLSLFENERFVQAFKNETEAIIKVAEKYEVPVDTARHMVESQEKFFFSKSAQPNITSNADYSVQGVPDHFIQEPYYDYMQVPSENAPPYINYGGPPSPKTNPKKQVEDLMALSQVKGLKIFDEGMIGLLAKMQDPGVMIKKYVPHLNNAMDRLGKILLMIWYHGYKIKKDFGIEEFPQFEENVKDTFMNLGDIILDIHKRDLNRELT